MARKPRRAAPDSVAEPSATPTAPTTAAKTTRAFGDNSAPKGKTISQGTTASKGHSKAKAGTGAKAVSGARGDLSPIKAQAIRQFALDLARKGAGPDTVLICNPISEPSALPAKELLYDRCRWCETDIYYDRLMPSPPDLMRVCLPCGVLLIKAEKKGAN